MSPPATANSRNENMVGIAWRAASATTRSIRLLKRGSPPTSSAPVRAWTTLAKAASISRSVLAFNNWIFNPMTEAAAITSDVIGANNRIVGVLEKADRRNAGHQIMQQRYPLGPEFTDEHVEARQVASRTIEASDEAELHRID